MKVQGNLFLNCHSNTIRIRDLGSIKVGYDFHNHLESYRNMMQLQISCRRAKRSGVT